MSSEETATVILFTLAGDHLANYPNCSLLSTGSYGLTFTTQSGDCKSTNLPYVILWNA